MDRYTFKKNGNIKNLFKNKEWVEGLNKNQIKILMGEPDYSHFGYKYEIIYKEQEDGEQSYFGCWLEFLFNVEDGVIEIHNICH